MERPSILQVLKMKDINWKGLVNILNISAKILNNDWTFHVEFYKLIPYQFRHFDASLICDLSFKKLKSQGINPS